MPSRSLRVLAVLAGLSVAIPALLDAGGITRGLRADYFDTPDRSGAPLFRKIDPDVSTRQVTSSWIGRPPGAFSVRWVGYIAVDRPGTYVVGTRSDDGSWLTIDSRQVVDNGGHHAPLVRSAPLHLDAGEHPVLLEYTQDVAGYDVALLWGDSASSLAPIPAWRLSPTRHPLWKLRLAHVLDDIADVLLIVALVYAIWLAATNGRTVARHITAWPRTAALVFFVVLTSIETWPLAAHPARLSRNDNGDTLLNEWAISWVAHQAPRDPLHLFDANIFYPDKDTLAYSESMIVQSAMAAPLLSLGASPVLAFNLVLLAGFALSGWAMSIVMARWTGSWATGVMSGAMFAFNAHTLTRLPHLQAQHVEFFPLALLALDELLLNPGVSRAVRVAVWFALQALTSMYLLVFTAVSLGIAVLVRPEAWTKGRFTAAARALFVAAAIAAVLLIPYLLPYWQLFRGRGMTRTLGETISFAATWQGYLSTPGWLHYTVWSHRFFAGIALFPGATAIVLSLVALASGVAFRDARARMCLAFGVAGVILSFGGKVPGYALLYRVALPLHATRTVSGYGYLGIVSAAMLAGFGAVEIRRRIAPAAWRWTAAALIALAAFEPFCAPIGYTRFEGTPSIYASVASEPRAVVAEFPFFAGNAGFLNAQYMLNSTSHWKPMLNGYSGFRSASFDSDAVALAGFPDASSLAALGTIGVTDIFVHTNQLSRADVGILDGSPRLRRVEAEGPIVRYRVTTPAAAQ